MVPRSHSMRELLKRAFPLQRGDLSRGTLLVAYLFFIISAYQVARVARDALFLGQFPATLLPYADITVFALVGVAVSAYVSIGERAGLRLTLVGSLVVFGLSGLAFAALHAWMNPTWLFPFFYVWVGIFGVLAPAQGWTLANYVVTPREAKRLFGLVAAGASLGATFGALLTRVVSRRVGAESLPVVMAVLVLIAAMIVEILWRRRPAGLAELETNTEKEKTPKGLRDSLRVVAGSPYLRAIAGVIGLASLVTYLIGWQFRAIVQQSVLATAGVEGRADALASFIATFEGAASIGCLFIQVLLTAGLFRRFGLRSALFALPIGLFAGSLGLLVLGGTVMAVLVPRGIDRVVRYSMERPAVELLYLPVPLAVKLRAKSFIDTVVWRVGDAGLGGLTVLGLVTLGGVTAAQLTWVTLPLIGLWLAVAAGAYRLYLSTLRQSLQQHVLDLDQGVTPPLDKVTTDMLASRLAAPDPEEILYALDLMEEGPLQAAHPAVRGLLKHPSPEVRRRALEILESAGDRTAVPDAESLLGDPSLEVRTEALLYLARHADVDPVARAQEMGGFSDAALRGAVISVLARLGGEHVDAARLAFEAMVSADGPGAKESRLEAALLAERLPVVFEQPLRRLILDADPEVAGVAIRAARRHGGGPFAEDLVTRLSERAFREEAWAALAGAGAAACQALGRALEAPHPPPEILRAAPEILEQIGTDEAAAVLAGSLLQGNAEFRLHVLKVLSRMRARRPELVIDSLALEAVVGAEILGHYRSYQILGALELSTLEQEPTTRNLRVAMLEELERVFLLLGLLHPGINFRAAWEGLRSGNAVLHDQALDLLESELRPEMRSLLVPLVDPVVHGAERMRLAEKLSGTPVDSPQEAVRALAGTGDPWLKACAAYAIGALGLRELEGYLAEWGQDLDPLLRETVRQAREQLDSRRD
jgi:AAA family ATP:ADP antiporter